MPALMKPRDAVESRYLMASGGARTNSGPPPDPNAARRMRKSDSSGWTTLPAEGRKGNAPAFPLEKWRDMEKFKPTEERDDALSRSLDARELAVWREIWKTPQAVAWERLGWKHDVGLYVRVLVAGERGNLKAAGEARQWSDRLGLTQTALLRNRWKIATDELAEKRQDKQRAATSARRESSRDRMHVVRNGTAR